jgi:beta-lactamase regulating signal transducer with metallopeptidase domain
MSSMTLSLTTVSWLLTYSIHSTLLLGSTWLATRVRGISPSLRDLLWTTALLGGLITSALQVGLEIEPWAGRLWIAAPGISRSEPAVAAARVISAGPTHEASGAISAAMSAPIEPSLSAPTTEGEKLLAPPEPSLTLTSSPVGEVSGETRAPWTDLVLASWLIVGLSGLVVLGLQRVRWTLQIGPRRPVTDGFLSTTLLRLARQAGLRRRIRLSTSPRIASPIAIGASEICLPVRARTQLTPLQQECMLAHELAHLIRRDPGWLLFAASIERLFFFQPLNRLARRGIQESAEFLCDDLAIQRTGHRRDLATCLGEVAAWSASDPSPHLASAMAESGSTLVRRVERLLETSPRPAKAIALRERALFPVALLAATASAAPSVSNLASPPGALSMAKGAQQERQKTSSTIPQEEFYVFNLEGLSLLEFIEFGKEALQTELVLHDDARRMASQTKIHLRGVTRIPKKDYLKFFREVLESNGLKLARASDRDPWVVSFGEQEAAAPSPFAGRRHMTVRGGKGASTKTESAADAGLKWLARHQSADGSWDPEQFRGLCHGESKCVGTGYPEHQVGATSLALLAFLGTGYDENTKKEWSDKASARTIRVAETVKKGLLWLLSQQNEQGSFALPGGKWGYNHSLATYAMAEAYGLSGSADWKASAQDGLNALVAGQNADPTSQRPLGWRYKPRDGENDISVTGWATLTLIAARLSGLEVPQRALDGALRFCEEVTDSRTGEVGYTKREEAGQQVKAIGKNENYRNHPGLAAIGMCIRALVGQNLDDVVLEAGARMHLTRDLPTWNKAARTNDYYYWHFGSLALNQYDGPDSPRVGRGEYWGPWDAAVKRALLDNQINDPALCADGSWDADDRWGFEGSRVYATAINVLTLEVYYRYGNVFVRTK